MKRIFSVLVENRSGVLCKVAGLFSRRSFNIDSLAVGETDDNAVSMMTIIEAGANIIGGCCGTSPSYIEKLHCLAQNMAFTSSKE